MPGDRPEVLRSERLEIADHSVVRVDGVDPILSPERAGATGDREERCLPAPADLRTRADPALLAVRRIEDCDLRDRVRALREDDRAPIDRPGQRIPDLRHVAGILILDEQTGRTAGGVADADTVVSVERVARAVRTDHAVEWTDGPYLVVLIEERRAPGDDVDEVQRRPLRRTDRGHEEPLSVGRFAERRRVVGPCRRATRRD